MLFSPLFVLFTSIMITAAVITPTELPDEVWGYVTVRENTHMFWWLYGAEDQMKRDKLPLILWLQGGPGASGTGYGNFMEIGPQGMDFKARNTTWIKKANLLFIDNPVGAGYSYVTNENAYTTNVNEISEDLFTIFAAILDKHRILKSTPLYIFGESYGGKMGAVFANRLYNGQKRGEITSNLIGVAFGDSWISPFDSMSNWGTYLHQFNLLDQFSMATVVKLSQEMESTVRSGEYIRAAEIFSHTESFISNATDDVDLSNVLKHHIPPDYLKTSSGDKTLHQLYANHIAIHQSTKLSRFMNSVVLRAKLKIPDDVFWGSQSDNVIKYQLEDLMQPVIEYVDKLLEYDLKVVVYQGQLDMICATPGTEKWIAKLRWQGLRNFLKTRRKALYLPGGKSKTQAFLKTYQNFSFYYILNAGHMVPFDNGEMALEMIDQILNGLTG